jgi:hypothetical protein
LSWGWILAGLGGCGGVASTTDPADPVASSQEALFCIIQNSNCKGICVQEFGCCLKSGELRTECLADRDQCFDDCARFAPEPP